MVPRTDQVMTQVEFPPYCGPHGPLDLVVVVIVFGHIFEAFHRMSHACTSGAVPIDDDKTLQKRHCQAPIAKRMLAPR
jgi:hypothetical protein